jgi:sugar fermentation stimulation protein A
VLLFVVNHSAVREVRPADHIDPEYGRLLRQADKAGVALLAWQSGLGVEPGGGYGTLSLVQPLPVFLG